MHTEPAVIAERGARCAHQSTCTREGKVPDLDSTPSAARAPTPCTRSTLLEHKTVSYGLQYQHAVTRRSRRARARSRAGTATRCERRNATLTARLVTPRGTVGPVEALLATFRLVSGAAGGGALRGGQL